MIIHSLVRRTHFTGLLQPRHPREDVMIRDIGIIPVVAKFHTRVMQITGCHHHRLTLAKLINLCQKICRQHSFRAGLQMLRIKLMEMLNLSSEHKPLAWPDNLRLIVLVRNLLSFNDLVQLLAIDALAEVEEIPFLPPEKPPAWSDFLQTYCKRLTYHINISPTTIQQYRTITPGLHDPI
jgi:hypothetical protein